MKITRCTRFHHAMSSSLNLHMIIESAKTKDSLTVWVNRSLFSSGIARRMMLIALCVGTFLSNVGWAVLKANPTIEQSSPSLMRIHMPKFFISNRCIFYHGFLLLVIMWTSIFFNDLQLDDSVTSYYYWNML